MPNSVRRSIPVGAIQFPCGHCGAEIKGHRQYVHIKCAICHLRLCNSCTGETCKKKVKNPNERL